jgi:hypothetical protein
VIHELYTSRVPFSPVPFPADGDEDDRPLRIFQSIAEGRGFMGVSERDPGYQIPHIVARVLEEDTSVDIAALILGLRSEKKK